MPASEESSSETGSETEQSTGDIESGQSEENLTSYLAATKEARIVFEGPTYESADDKLTGYLTDYKLLQRPTEIKRDTDHDLIKDIRTRLNSLHDPHGMGEMSPDFEDYLNDPKPRIITARYAVKLSRKWPWFYHNSKDIEFLPHAIALMDERTQQRALSMLNPAPSFVGIAREGKPGRPAYPSFNYQLDTLFLDYQRCGFQDDRESARYMSEIAQALDCIVCHAEQHPGQDIRSLMVSFCLEAIQEMDPGKETNPWVPGFLSWFSDFKSLQKLTLVVHDCGYERGVGTDYDALFQWLDQVLARKVDLENPEIKFETTFAVRCVEQEVTEEEKDAEEWSPPTEDDFVKKNHPKATKLRNPYDDPDGVIGRITGVKYALLRRPLGKKPGTVPEVESDVVDSVEEGSEEEGSEEEGSEEEGLEEEGSEEEGSEEEGSKEEGSEEEGSEEEGSGSKDIEVIEISSDEENLDEQDLEEQNPEVTIISSDEDIPDAAALEDSADDSRDNPDKDMPQMEYVWGSNSPRPLDPTVIDAAAAAAGEVPYDYTYQLDADGNLPPLEFEELVLDMDYAEMWT